MVLTLRLARRGVVVTDPGESAVMSDAVKNVISDEYGAHAGRILDAFENARLILVAGSFLPLQAMSFAYSVRTAADALFDRSGYQVVHSTRESVDQLSEAIELFDSQRSLGVPEAELLAALRPRIDAVLDSRKAGSRAEQAYRYVFARRMGDIGPLLAAKLNDLLSLRERVASALHSEMSLLEAQLVWEELVELLTALFSSPTERIRALDALADLETPTAADLVQVDSLALTPAHTRQFLRSLKSVGWLDAMAEARWLTADMIKTWGALGDLFYSFEREPAAVTGFSVRILNYLDSTDSALCAAFAVAAMDSGPEGAPVIVPLLRQHPRAIAMPAIRWASSLDKTSGFITDVADVVLNDGVSERASSVATLLAALAEGVDADNALSRLQCLEWKLARVPERTFSRIIYFESGISILKRPGATRRSMPEAILDAYANTLPAAEAALGAGPVLASIERLPTDIRARIRVAFAARSVSLEQANKLRIFADYAREDWPNIDGLALLDALTDELGAQALGDRISLTIGPPPTVDDLEQQIRDADLDYAHWRLARWALMLPEGALREWEGALEIMSRHITAKPRAYWESQSEVTSRPAISPFSVADLGDRDVFEVCAILRDWRASDDDWPAGPREVARVLTEAVAANPRRWTLPSVTAIFDELRHPTYVDGVIDGFRTAGDGWTLTPAELAEVCTYVWSRRGEVAEEIGTRGDWEYVEDWDQVRRPAIDLIESYANRTEYDLGTAIETLWPLVRDSAEQWELGDRPKASGDPLHRALNRDSTRAFLAAFALMGAEFRRSGESPSQGTELLERSLDVAGDDGSEYRALIAAHHRFIQTVASSWWASSRARLLGDGTQQARDAFDMMLTWNQPDEETFRTHVAMVKNAIDRGVDRAPEQMVTACLTSVSGYSPGSVVRYLLDSPDHDQLGERVAWVVEPLGEPSADLVSRVFEMWSVALEVASADDLVSFGRLALVSGIPGEAWLEYTKRTLVKTAGRLAYASDVAERIEHWPATISTLHVFDLLVRTAQPNSDYYGVAQLAVSHLNSAVDLRDQAEYRSLRIALLERGLRVRD